MDNFFDIATPEEVAERYSYTPSAQEIAAERAALAQNSDANFSELAYLFADRGDYAQAVNCLNQISDDLTRADTGRILAHDSTYLDWHVAHP